HLVDPDGCDYFSLGPCGIRPGDMGRIDNYEKMCDWLPDMEGEYADCYEAGVRRRNAYMKPYSYKMISFPRVNLRRIYGDQWMDAWKRQTSHILMQHGINSQGNGAIYLDVNNGSSRLPYVRQLPEFPITDTLIFRDFPDVLSPQYRERSARYALTLDEWKDDPWLIGYFMRNEPEFNFVKKLLIADEVLHNPAYTYCKAGLLQFLRGRYGTVEALNRAWGTAFECFEDLEKPIDFCSITYPGSEKDIREYSIYLIREYIRVPALACRAIDPHHLNLGLRWSEAYNEVMMAGWEYFDVFSINCYYFDPTEDMDFVVKAGVDLPIMIGEYHCGALDRGLTATGLKGVTNQYERGVMWRYFVERVAAHPCGIGAHWFQYNDQFALGRFDGENYQIGMVDVCMRPEKELLDAALETSRLLYRIKNGEMAPVDRHPEAIPMIGY
ncbi:MAG: beta-galactosidase, partial [Clostridia bacterium]|nr:beta-galactosidase [Clostridia bacterium]